MFVVTVRKLKFLLSLVIFPVFIQTVSLVHADITQAAFNPVESTISQLHFALTHKFSNCESITRVFIRRIKQYDKSTHLNSIILINKNALAKARALDKEYSKNHKLRALHCIPVILKDNFDTHDMPTEAGSIALKGSLPPDDAFMVKQLRKAGAIIIAKSNMGEWAFSPYNTISSTHGETLNAYNIQHVPAGSSGGTASAIAASFGIIGMGTDTGNSIRGPASHLALVGMRSTMGLTSRDGIVPLVLNRDIAGPLTRTVEDAAKVFTVIAGFDKADAITHNEFSKRKIDYASRLKLSSLKGVRLAVMRQLYETETADFEILDLMDQAIKDLKQAGAIIVDPFEILNFKKVSQATGFCSRFRYDLNRYLGSLNYNSDHPPAIAKFQDIVDKKLFNKRSASSITWAASVNIRPQDQQPPCIDVEGDPRRKALLTLVIDAMDKQNIDAIIYPSWSNPPTKTGDTTGPYGNNSSLISPHTGQPSITVPMGYTEGDLPAGLQFLGRPFDDARLFVFAYAYEQQTHHRKPPELFIKINH